MLRWIRLTALVAADETQASPVKPASGWSAIRAWRWSRRVGSSSDASGLLSPTVVAPHSDVDYGPRGVRSTACPLSFTRTSPRNRSTTSAGRRAQACSIRGQPTSPTSRRSSFAS